jgi:hypothetical protein
MPTQSVCFQYDCFACQDCDFQRFKQTANNDTRWKKMITRLHKKKCLKTGRTKKMSSWKEMTTTAGKNPVGYVKSKIIMENDGETIKIAGNSKELQSAQEKTSKSV